MRFVGYVPDMRSFYASVDIVVLPSRSEGCPNVVLESMAMRRALVVSDSAGSREVVTNGVTGLMFPIGDVGALAAALGRLLDDPVLRRDAGPPRTRAGGPSFDAQASAARLAGVLRRQLTPGVGRVVGDRRAAVEGGGPNVSAAAEHWLPLAPAGGRRALLRLRADRVLRAQRDLGPLARSRHRGSGRSILIGVYLRNYFSWVIRPLVVAGVRERRSRPTRSR